MKQSQHTRAVLAETLPGRRVAMGQCLAAQSKGDGPGANEDAATASARGLCPAVRDAGTSRVVGDLGAPSPMQTIPRAESREPTGCVMSRLSASGPRRSFLRRLRGARAAALALAALATLAVGLPAAAQAVVLVSNFGHTGTAGNVNLAAQNVVGIFTTGGSDATLDSIEFKLSQLVPNTVAPTVKLYAVTVAGRQATQGTEAATLITPSTSLTTSTFQTFTYTAPSGTILTASTKYIFVLEPPSAGLVVVQTTTDRSEDAGEAGWTIDGSSSGTSPYYIAAVAQIVVSVNGTLTTNDAPTAANKTVTTAEDTAYTFTADDFGFADTDGDTLASVKIVTVPVAGNGTLELSGTAVVADEVVPEASIGNLAYIPPENANGTGYASFTFKVSDGTDESAVANTMTIDVTPGNDPATGEPTITGTAQVGQTLTAVTTGILDEDGLTSPTYTYQWIRVDGTEDDIAGENSSTYTLVDADLGKTIKVRVSFDDDGGNTETLTSAATATVTAAPNTAPTAADNTVTTAEDTAYTFTATDFGYFDADGDTLASVKIVTLPASGNGTLALSGTAVATDEVVPAASIGNLAYTPPENANGPGYASFTFKVSDGTDESAVANTMTIDVTAGNDPATGEPTITGTAQVGRTLTAVTTGITDADGLTSVTYTYQWIRVDGTEDDIAGENSSTYTLVDADLGKTIKVRVSFDDDGGNTETLTSAATATVTAPNTAPTAADNTVTTAHDTAYTFTATDFGFADADTGDTLASVKIVTVPTPGALALDGTAVLANAVVTKAQIDGNNFTFTPEAGESGDPYTTFTFKVNDGTVDSAVANTMTIDVTAGNDPAMGAPTITGTAQVGQTLTAVTTGITDADGLTSPGPTRTSGFGRTARRPTLRARIRAPTSWSPPTWARPSRSR